MKWISGKKQLTESEKGRLTIQGYLWTEHKDENFTEYMIHVFTIIIIT